LGKCRPRRKNTKNYSGSDKPKTSSRAYGSTAIVVAKENDISLITLPPLTSHKVQPSDCTIFGPYGTYYHTCPNDWILSNQGKYATISSFAFTIGKTFGKTFVKHNVEKVFPVTEFFFQNENIFL